MAGEGKKAEVFELNNGTMQVKITNYGCIITFLSIPDKDGNSFLFSLPFLVMMINNSIRS